MVDYDLQDQIGFIEDFQQITQNTVTSTHEIFSLI